MVGEETPPNIRRKMSEISLIKSFQEARGQDRDEVLSQAPDAQDGYFRVPRILDT